MYSSVAGVIHKNFSDVNGIDHSINDINHIGHINDNHNDHNMNTNFNNQTTSYIFNDSTTNISNMTELNNHFTTIIYNVVTHALFYSISIIGILGNIKVSLILLFKCFVEFQKQLKQQIFGSRCM
ncbi:hypothetical protein HELRODRAFT_160379 [Helobdella robusta]|uniref:Uncharacterized protein n=1 Tax=Helobdella robusta TaxID=6412 RepID=T1EQ62_HELRO|nr:hypothetical protein HELRODRAFT_160379 [Helobdella robusta]ESO06221.1 hypothetical protein HELRODRAFT_160379 [Helobdella robusta]